MTAENRTEGMPGRPESFWIATAPRTYAPSLIKDARVDVAVIGGGVAGIMSAYYLKEAGLKVALLESRRILEGVTGHTTAKITALHGLIYDHLIAVFGRERARQYAEANQAAIEEVAALVDRLQIDCDFSRQPFHSFAETQEHLHKIEKETNAARTLGLPATFVDSIPLPLEVKGAVRLDNQAQFHPLKFLRAIAATIPDNGSYVFEETRALDIEDGEPCVVLTNQGKIKARDVVVATNYPFFDKSGLYFARLNQVRSYVYAIRTKEIYPGGMFAGVDKLSLAFRSQPTDAGDIVIVSGVEHKPGHAASTVSCYEDLAAAVNRIFHQPVLDYRWSTQDNVTIDKVPYIGKATPFSKRIMVATGFAQWGMTTSVVAAQILSNLIQGKPEDRAPVFDPNRFKLDSAVARELVSHNTTVLKDLVSGRLAKPDEDVTKIKPGEGKLAGRDGKKIAVYKDMEGRTYTLSPKCTHMGCIVAWNDAERSWDCPCHGTRFSHEGEVIHAPAVKDLPQA